MVLGAWEEGLGGLMVLGAWRANILVMVFLYSRFPLYMIIFFLNSIETTVKLQINVFIRHQN